MQLGVTDYIDCAHFLPGHPKCGALHGHTYKVEFMIEGETGPDGMILDFEEVKEKLRAVLSEYDHRSLNDFMDYRPLRMSARRSATNSKVGSSSPSRCGSGKETVSGRNSRS